MIIYSGSTILGGDTVIGKGTVVGGNVWLTRSVPPGSNISQAQMRQEEFEGGTGKEFEGGTGI